MCPFGRALNNAIMIGLPSKIGIPCLEEPKIATHHHLVLFSLLNALKYHVCISDCIAT
jgi:hypothetical protein